MSALHLNLNDDDPWIIEQRMFDLLNDYLQPSSTKSALSTAQALDDLFPTNRRDEDQPEGEPREEAESFLWHMWPLFHKIAQQIPHSHPSQEKLAGLVKTLRGLTSKTPIVHLWGSDRKLWGDLPLIGPALREEIDRTDYSDDEGRQNWRNINAYLARLTRDRSADFFVIAIQEIGGALEGCTVFRHQHAHPGEVQTDFVPGRDEDIATAADWISLCGRVLFNQDEEVDGSQSGPLWKGKHGLCPERWQLWKDRLSELSNIDGVAEETRELARETRAKMEMIEKETEAQ